MPPKRNSSKKKKLPKHDENKFNRNSNEYERVQAIHSSLLNCRMNQKMKRKKKNTNDREDTLKKYKIKAHEIVY